MAVDRDRLKWADTGPPSGRREKRQESAPKRESDPSVDRHLQAWANIRVELLQQPHPLPVLVLFNA